MIYRCAKRIDNNHFAFFWEKVGECLQFMYICEKK